MGELVLTQSLLVAIVFPRFQCRRYQRPEEETEVFVVYCYNRKQKKIINHLLGHASLAKIAVDLKSAT